MDNNDTTLLASSGDYHQLICYQKAVIVYDLTYWFCERYMERSKDRTVDQMVQAARSGKQNIVEGITDGAASKESELKLLKVAAGSLHELHEDYEDWLRTHHHPIWAKDSVEMKALWAVGKEHSDSEYFMQLARTRPPQTTANHRQYRPGDDGTGYLLSRPTNPIQGETVCREWRIEGTDVSCQAAIPATIGILQQGK